MSAPRVRTRRSDELAALARAHRDQINEICARHGCRNPRIVGSVAVGDADMHSDLDLMADVDAGRSIFDLAGAKTPLDTEGWEERFDGLWELGAEQESPRLGSATSGSPPICSGRRRGSVDSPNVTR